MSNALTNANAINKKIDQSTESTLKGVNDSLTITNQFIQDLNDSIKKFNSSSTWLSGLMIIIALLQAVLITKQLSWW